MFGVLFPLHLSLGVKIFFILLAGEVQILFQIKPAHFPFSSGQLSISTMLHQAI
jgi:hypothetical protein